MRKELVKDKYRIQRDNFEKDCLTTTELAKLCGVSRFTIINWIKQGKIRANKTLGGHSRIPVSEAIFFYETLLKEKMGVSSESLYHCWEHPHKTNCDNVCKNCLIYGNAFNYCFLVVREFGKEAINCKGDCINCEYFEEFFSDYNNKVLNNEITDAEEVDIIKDKKTFLYSFAYSFGRGIKGLKGKATGIKEVFTKRSTKAKRMAKSNK